MKIALRAAIVILGLVAVSTEPLHGQNGQRYREFQLGDSVASVSAKAGVEASDVKDVHVRPALMQELQWRRGYSVAAQADSVQQIAFSFYNDQLTKLVVDYDRERTKGLTDADMIDALSPVYGPPLKPVVKSTHTVASQIEIESGPPVARWGDAEYSVVLYRSSYESGFRLIVISSKLDALAQAAAAQAMKLDDREAPQRELARQKKEADDSRTSQEKARTANKAVFQP